MGVLARPGKKTKKKTTRELFFVNHQSLKQNRIRRQANQPRSLPTKDSTKKPNDHVAQVTHLGDKSGIHHSFSIQAGYPTRFRVRNRRPAFWSHTKCNANLRNRNKNLEYP